MFSHRYGYNFAVFRIGDVESLSSLVLAEGEKIVPRNVIMNQNLAQVFDLLHDIHLPA